MPGKRIQIAIAFAVCVVVVGVALKLRERREFPSEYDRTISSTSTGLSRILFSDDGQTLYASGGNGDVVHWQMPGNSGGETISPRAKSPVSVFGLSPDGLLLAGDLTGRIRSWQTPSLESVEVKSPTIPPTSVVFRDVAGEKQIFLGLAEGTIVTIEESGVTTRESGHRGVKALVLSIDQSTLISAGSEGTVIWSPIDRDEDNAAKSITTDGHETEVSALEVSPDGELLISGDLNGKLRVHSTKSKELLAEFSQPDAVSGLALLEDTVITGSWDGHIRIWDTVLLKEPRLISDIDTGAPVLGIAVTSDGKTAATVSGSGDVDFWSLPN